MHRFPKYVTAVWAYLCGVVPANTRQRGGGRRGEVLTSEQHTWSIWSQGVEWNIYAKHEQLAIFVVTKIGREVCLSGLCLYWVAELAGRCPYHHIRPQYLVGIVDLHSYLPQDVLTLDVRFAERFRTRWTLCLEEQACFCYFFCVVTLTSCFLWSKGYRTNAFELPFSIYFAFWGLHVIWFTWFHPRNVCIYIIVSSRYDKISIFFTDKNLELFTLYSLVNPFPRPWYR